jgi:hypothetical protein
MSDSKMLDPENSKAAQYSVADLPDAVFADASFEFVSREFWEAIVAAGVPLRVELPPPDRRSDHGWRR